TGIKTFGNGGDSYLALRYRLQLTIISRKVAKEQRRKEEKEEIFFQPL
ncbi:MAG: hypothetical protein RLZZ86_3616, partial [Cyanobacteriota bacterium]